MQRFSHKAELIYLHHIEMIANEYNNVYICGEGVSEE